jgi:hypothetical protein
MGQGCIAFIKMHTLDTMPQTSVDVHPVGELPTCAICGTQQECVHIYGSQGSINVCAGCIYRIKLATDRTKELMKAVHERIVAQLLDETSI